MRRVPAILLMLGLGSAAYVVLLVATNNFHTVLAGTLYRSAQPSAMDITNWSRRYGIRTIINLRGANSSAPWYQKERKAAVEAGIELIDYELWSHRDVTPGEIEKLLEILSRARPPILIHCLRGADRSGFGSALYLSGVAGSSELAAEIQLTPLFGHISLPFLPSFAMDRSWEVAEPMVGFPES